MPEHVQVMPGTPEVFSGTGKESKKPFTMIKQAAMLVHEDGRVEAFTLIAPKEKDGTTKAFPPGKYALGVRPYVVNGEMRLAPIYTAMPGAPK